MQPKHYLAILSEKIVSQCPSKGHPEREEIESFRTRVRAVLEQEIALGHLRYNTLLEPAEFLAGM